MDSADLELLLDDPAGPVATDPAGLLRALATAGAQVREMAARGDEVGLTRLAAGGAPRSLLLVGEPPVTLLAGLIPALGDQRADCPVLLLPADVALPNWVSAADLVVVAGTSPEREPELARMAESARRRGAALLGVGRGDGTLEERCQWARAPYVVVPPGRGEPVAFWSTATPILRLAAELGLIELDVAALAAALDATAEVCRPDADVFVNPAKLLAVQLVNALPLLVGDSAATGAVAGLVGSALARHAGVPSVPLVLPGQAEEAAAYLTGPFAPTAAQRDPFRDRADEAGPALRMVTISDGSTGTPGAQARHELSERAARAGIPVVDLAVGADRPDERPHLPRLAGQLLLGEFAAGYLRLGR